MRRGTRYPKYFSKEDFSIVDLPGLLGWYDYADPEILFTDSAKTTPVADDGDVIGAVEDKSGNGNDKIQAGADSLKPLYKTGANGLNGLSVGLYDGLANTLNIPGISSGVGNYTIFAVTDPDYSGEDRFLFDTQTGRLVVEVAGATGAIFDGDWRGSPVGDANPSLVTWQLDSTGSIIRLNGAIVETGVAYTARAIGGTTRFGSASTSSAFFFKGNVCEFVICAGILSGSFITLAENLLRSKWGTP